MPQAYHWSSRNAYRRTIPRAPLPPAPLPQLTTRRKHLFARDAAQEPANLRTVRGDARTGESSDERNLQFPRQCRQVVVDELVDRDAVRAALPLLQVLRLA